MRQNFHSLLNFFLHLSIGTIGLGLGYSYIIGHLTFYSAQRLDLFAWCVRLSRLLVGFRTHFKSLHFHSFHSFIHYRVVIIFRRRQTLITAKKYNYWLGLYWVMLLFLEYYLKMGTVATRLHSCFILRLRLVWLLSIWSRMLYSLHPCASPITCNSIVFVYSMCVVINEFMRWTKAINESFAWKQDYNLWCLWHQRIADTDSPMFQKAPMLSMFNVRCTHWPNINKQMGSEHWWCYVVSQACPAAPVRFSSADKVRYGAVALRHHCWGWKLCNL